MTKSSLLLTAITLFLGSTSVALAQVGPVPQVRAAGIIGSKHDFSSMAWSGGEICKPCHTPHFADTQFPVLWNHTMSSATYTLHGGSGGQDDMDVGSRMCLSCHDGTVALDSFGGQTGSSFVPARYRLGTDLSNDHPVGSQAQYPPSPQPSWWSGAFRDPSQIPSALSLREWIDGAGQPRMVVSCMSCHNPHREGGYPGMLNMRNVASALCLGCHIK